MAFDCRARPLPHFCGRLPLRHSASFATAGIREQGLAPTKTAGHYPVGGRPCGRMHAVAHATIREQGLAPTSHILKPFAQTTNDKGAQGSFVAKQLGSDPN